MDWLFRLWEDSMQIPEARWIILMTVLALSLLVAIYFSFYFRGMALGSNNADSTDILTELRKMRDEGFLNEDEFSRAKSQLNPQTERATEVEFSEIKEAVKEEKKFLTLAEAQALKKQNQPDQPDATGDNEQTSETTEEQE